MEKKNITCTICPLACSIEVSEDKNSPSGYLVKGNTCKRGEAYAIAEFTNPTRVVTSTVRLKSASIVRLPVRTDKPIPKKLIFECMKKLNSVVVTAPVKMGDIVVKDILGTGANIIASRSI